MISCGLPANRAPRRGPGVERVAGERSAVGAGHVVADVAGVVRVEGVAGALRGGFDVEVARDTDPLLVVRDSRVVRGPPVEVGERGEPCGLAEDREVQRRT
jgi:hypothetical protein